MGTCVCMTCDGRWACCFPRVAERDLLYEHDSAEGYPKVARRNLVGEAVAVIDKY